MSKQEQDPLLFYQKQLKVDKENLDEELSNFPSLFYTVSEHYLEAYKHVKRLEQRMDRKFASLASAFRSAADSEGSKITETQIKQEVEIHPTYRKAKAKLSDAVYIKDRWGALKDAYNQKSFSMKGLVSLANDEKYQSESSSKGRGRS